MGPEKVQAGFKITGLIPYDSEKVIDGVNFKPRTPTPSNSHPASSIFTNPNTPHTARDALRGSVNLKFKITRHQSSSPTHLYELVDNQAKAFPS